MTVTGITKDPQSQRMAIEARFDAPPARVWQVWADPRQLERWWGPPTYPATVIDHDLSPGGAVTYVMVGPDGDKHAGWWRITAANPPHTLEFEDGFADESGTPNPDMPVTVVRVTLTDHPDGGTGMTIESRFPSTEAMQQMVEMGMEEGMTAAMGQIDGLLAHDVR